jgi:hypothetical protein
MSLIGMRVPTVCLQLFVAFAQPAAQPHRRAALLCTRPG